MKVSRIFNVLMALFLIAAAMANVQPVAAQRSVASPAGDITSDTLYVPGEVIVTFADGQTASTTGAQATALAGQVSAQVVGVSGSIALLSFAEDADVEALSAQLAASAGVEAASPNYIGWVPEARGFTASSPISSSGHPALAKTQVYRTGANGQAVTVSKKVLGSMRTIRGGIAGTPTYPVEDSAGVDDWGWWETNTSIIWPNVAVAPAVCLIDTGVDFLNPDLVGKMLAQKDFVNEDAIANDDNGHGTHVAGIIAGSNSNKKGMIGVSNGKIVAVKALSAQGWGTTYDLVEAINYCAANASVKAINLSLGGFPANVNIYNALNNAITTKGKFVVAAAGNDRSSAYTFPAAWASSTVCKDGNPLSEPCAGANINQINTGLISVGAGYDWGNSYYDVGGFDSTNADPTGDGDGFYWVDMDNDGNIDNGGLAPFDGPNENFDSKQCLWDDGSFGSNYGSWVQMIAPGSGIYSTLPISYPYTNIAADEEGGYDGLGYMSGTSMAAPFVSGAAVRVISASPALPVLTPAAIKTKLMSTGRAMNAVDNLAADSGVLVGDITKGYAAAPDTINAPLNAQVLNAGTGFSGEIPYCVPVANAKYTSKQDMSAAVYLDVAAAMGRTAVTASVKDATTGLPLAGAIVQAVQGTAIKDSATVGKLTPVVDLINIPNTYVAPVATTTIKVSKALYTTGFVSVAEIDTLSTIMYDTNEFMHLSIPPTGRITLVTDWDYTNVGNGAELDLFTYLPTALSFAPKIIGNPSGADLFDSISGVTAGVLFTPSVVGFTPNYKTRWNLDGGNPLYGGVGVESVTMMATGTAPFWNSVGSSNSYDFYLNDYGAGGTDMLGNSGPVVVRVWRAGLPIAATNGVTPAPFAYSLSAVCNSAGVDTFSGTKAFNADNQWLHIGHFGGSTTTLSNFYLDDSCVVGDVPLGGGANLNPGGGLPYGVNGGGNK